VDEPTYTEPARKLPVRDFDVVVAGGGTAGVVAALAAARQRAKTALIEAKGYPGGTVSEGGTALHSFFNLWKPFPGVEKRQVVRGIPQEIVDRLTEKGGCSGHGDQTIRTDYDSACTVVDTEVYKLTAFEMLDEAGVHVCVNTLLVGAVREGARVRGAIVESRTGREMFAAKCFVDCTGYGDLSAKAGAECIEQNDYAVCNSMGVANVDLDRFYEYLDRQAALSELAFGMRDGRWTLIRLNAHASKLPSDFAHAARELGLSMVTTTVHDNYLMFIKVNMKVEGSLLNRDVVAKAELELRRRQYRSMELFRQYIPGFEKAFIARTSPSLTIRRARTVRCDYDITHEDVVQARHFDDQVAVYGFHDSAPRYQVGKGETYGIPYRALCVAGIENLLAAGMLITSDRRAHMSTRNTVCCMAQGQAAGTAAALCARRNLGTRDLPYTLLRDTLIRDGVYFED